MNRTLKHNTLKHSTLGLSLILLLAACGNQTPATQTPSAQNPSVQSPVQTGGFTVDGKPNLVARKVTLPARQTMRVPVARPLSAQATSSLPAWTGPRLFAGLNGTKFATNSKHELFVGQSAVYNTEILPPLTRFSKFSSVGQGLGSSEFDTSGGKSGVPKWSANNWLVATEGQPERETYQINTNDLGQLQAQIYSNSGATLNAAVEPILPMTFPGQAFYGFEPSTTKIKAKGSGLVISSVNGVDQEDKSVVMYEAAYEPWKEIGLRISQVIRPPSAYKTGRTQSEFAVGSDGSVYLAVFTSYIGTACYDSFTTCPSVAGITKFTGEDIAWQVYWDTDEPVRLQDIAVSDSAVSLLVNIEDGSSGVIQSTLQNFSLDGVPISNQVLPAIPGEEYYSLLDGLKMDAAGKMVGYNAYNVLTGTQTAGFNRSLALVPEFDEYGESSIQDVNFSGDYLYVSGSTPNGLNNPTTPLPSSPYDYNLGTDPVGSFILPLDFDLNRRF